MLRYQKRQGDSSQLYTILDAKAATGTGTVLNVQDYRYIVFQVSAAASSSLTIKFQGSILDTAPDFSSAQTEANHWDYVATYDLQTPASVIPGDTGITLNDDTVANNCRLIYMNVDLMKWVNVAVTAYTDGDVTVKAAAAND